MSQDACPECGHQGCDTLVSRPSLSGRLRRRRCRECGVRWTTREVLSGQLSRVLAAQRQLLEFAPLVAELGRLLDLVRADAHRLESLVQDAADDVRLPGQDDEAEDEWAEPPFDLVPGESEFGRSLRSARRR